MNDATAGSGMDHAPTSVGTIRCVTHPESGDIITLIDDEPNPYAKSPLEQFTITVKRLNVTHPMKWGAEVNGKSWGITATAARSAGDALKMLGDDLNEERWPS